MELRMREKSIQLVCVLVLLVLKNNKTALGLFSSGGGGADEGDAKMIRCIERERKALLTFKEGLRDDRRLLSSWGSTVDCCKWRGIRCSNLTGPFRVTVLDLHDFHLSGNINNSSLLELQHLKYLDLSANGFEGNLPGKFIASLSRRLRHLNLANNSFSGPFPDQLRNLSNIEYLDLSFNGFLSSGNELEWLSHLSSLNHLDLSHSDLSKAVNWVETVNNLPLLKNLQLRHCNLPDLYVNPSNSSPSIVVLDLFGNNLSNSIHSWLFNLSSLTDIDLSYNQLKGSIPNAFGNLIYLVNLNLVSNQLEGIIPKSFTNLTRLQSLYLFWNDLSGKLEELLQNLSGSEHSLQTLQLMGNRLSGIIPDFTRFSSLKELGVSDNKLNGTVTESIGQLPNLQILDASSNYLQGIISEAHFSNLSKLWYLDMSSNKLILSFNSDWVPPFQLERMLLSSCKLGPHFPKWLQHHNKLSELDISGAGISDTIPSWFWDLSPILGHLNLSDNQWKGSLPNLSSKFPNGPSLDLSSNCFTGQIPPLPPNITVLNLSKNKFTGSISFLCAITGLQLSCLDLSGNLLSGGLPDCWQLFESMTVINLANNNFFGKLPSSMGSLYQLEALQLRNNNFSGELPRLLKNCTRLKIIELRGNKLTGKIPAWIGTHLSMLTVLSLGSNKFYGSIPREICYLNRVQILDLSLNDVSGELPKCVANFSALVMKGHSESTIIIDTLVRSNDGWYYIFYHYEGNALVQWKGQAREYVKNLRLLKVVDFSSNKLFGKIPEQFESLAELNSLNLSRNNLTGKIIKGIGQMKMLESLDLSSNRIFGEIPTSLAQLNFLAVLNLSNNNLSNKIPLSTQLQGFDASSFSGNPHLCGLPLPNKCIGESESPVTTHGKEKGIQDDDDDKFVTRGFYISLGLGFPFGFWATFGTVLFNHRSRHAYFSFLENIINWFAVSIALNMARLRRWF